MDCDNFLRGQWDLYLPSAGPPPGGAEHPDGVVRSCMPEDEYHQNRGDGLPTTPNGGQELGGYIKAVNDQGGPLSQGVIVRAGPMRVGPGGRVIGGAPP